MSYDQMIVGKILGQVDKLGADLTAHTYANLVTQFSPVIYTLTTFYLGMVFLSIKRGVISIGDLPFILLRMTCILTLALNYHYFCLFVYDVFTKAPLYICHAITINGSSASSVPISDAIDQFLRNGMLETSKLFLMGGWTNVTYTIFGVGVFLVTIVSAAVATGLIILAKIACVILLSLSPMFIFFAMFEPTKGMFNSYINQLFTYGLIPIMTCAILMIVLSVTGSTISQIDSSQKVSFTVLIPFLLSSIAQTWLLLQVQQKCAALASGFSLRSVASTLKDAMNGIKGSANFATGGQFGRQMLSRAMNMGSKGNMRMNRYGKSR